MKTTEELRAQVGGTWLALACLGAGVTTWMVWTDRGTVLALVAAVTCTIVCAGLAILGWRDWEECAPHVLVGMWHRDGVAPVRVSWTLEDWDPVVGDWTGQWGIQDWAPVGDPAVVADLVADLEARGYRPEDSEATTLVRERLIGIRFPGSVDGGQAEL